MNDKKQITTRRIGKRALGVAIAAVLALALGISVLAATGAFGMLRRTAEPEERFRLNFVKDQELYWENAKQVFTFDGPAEARTIHFKPGYLPAEVNNISTTDGDSWYTTLSCERSEEPNQPCRIDVYYAPRYINDGHLILLYDKPGEIMEKSLGELQVTEFESRRTITRSDTGEIINFDGAYVMLYHPAEGWLIVVSGRSDLPTLERVARELTVEQTDEVIRAADYEGENRFIDWGVG